MEFIVTVSESPPHQLSALIVYPLQNSFAVSNGAATSNLEAVRLEELRSTSNLASTGLALYERRSSTFSLAMAAASGHLVIEHIDYQRQKSTREQ